MTSTVPRTVDVSNCSEFRNRVPIPEQYCSGQHRRSYLTCSASYSSTQLSPPSCDRSQQIRPPPSCSTLTGLLLSSAAGRFLCPGGVRVMRAFLFVPLMAPSQSGPFCFPGFFRVPEGSLFVLGGVGGGNPQAGGCRCYPPRGRSRSRCRQSCPRNRPQLPEVSDSLRFLSSFFHCFTNSATKKARCRPASAASRRPPEADALSRSAAPGTAAPRIV